MDYCVETHEVYMTPIKKLRLESLFIVVTNKEDKCQVYKTVKFNWLTMGSRKRASLKPRKKIRGVEGRCPKCTTIVRFHVSGPIGDEIFECMGCMSKFHVDDL